MHNPELFELLYQKHIYRDTQGIKTNIQAVKEEYEKETGIPLSNRRYKEMKKEIDAEKLWEETNTKTFNQRTDDIIDKPSKLYWSDDLLLAMGADPDGDLEFDRTTINKWWIDGGDILERIRNGQLKVTLVKKKFELTEKNISKLLKQANIIPIWVDESVDNPHGLLEINLTDMHMGKNTYADYKQKLDKIIRWIKSQEWKEILIPIGNDLFHWDNINGTTTRGTQVGFEPDLDTAWQDAMQFYFPLIEEAIRHSVDVYIPYVRGNHDATLGWAFAKMLEQKFPQAIVDTSQDNYKLHTWEKIAIGLSHGDTPRDFKKYSSIFNELYRKEFAEATVREIHLGDKHHQMVHDEFGIVTRGLSTASKTDNWHYNSGYIGASKSFQIFIYTEDNIEGMIFI